MSLFNAVFFDNIDELFISNYIGGESHANHIIVDNSVILDIVTEDENWFA